MAGRRRPQQHPNRNHYQHQQPPFIKYEAREEDELDLDLDLDEKTAQLLTPQVIKLTTIETIKIVQNHGGIGYPWVQSTIPPWK